jgi:hypothetical protein
MQTERNFMAGLERLDAFLNGTEPGDIPLAVLRERGIEMPDDATLDDEQVHRRLGEVLVAMEAMGLVVEFTDHLSDREFYRYLGEALKEETMLTDDPNSTCHLTPLWSGSEDDNDIFLRYYASDEERRRFAEDGVIVPPKEPLPFDRSDLARNAERRTPISTSDALAARDRGRR